METQILNILNNKSRNYDNSKVLFSELLETFNCSNEELAICINGSQIASVQNRVEWDVNF